mgnify:CR=1 FL=1
MKGKKIKILIVDDHAVMREGLKRILNECDDLRVVDEACSGEEAIEKVNAGSFDLVMLDISMPGRGGMDALKEMRRIRPELPVLVLSMYPDDQYALRAFRAGAAGYVMKERSPDELVDAIHKVSSGGTHVTPSLAEKLAAHLAAGLPERPHEKLSDREDQVMRMLATGRSLKEIATELDLSVKTVSTYKRRIFQKTKLRNAAELIRYTIDNDLI